MQAVLIVNQEGVPIYSSTSDEEFAMDHAALISQLAAKAKSTIRTLDPTNDMTFLRIRSKKHEIMIAPGECGHLSLRSCSSLCLSMSRAVYEEIAGFTITDASCWPEQTRSTR